MTKKQDITAILKDKRGRVLSIGKNSYTKSHTLMHLHANKVGQPHKIYLHAEVDAVIKCKDIIKAHTLEVYRFNSKGQPMLAKPCKVCESMIKSTPIKVVVHT
jgi:deoxycytidylate deaminase